MGMGKRKVIIKKIEDKQKRLVCFTKRRNGLFKKAQQLSALTGAQTALLVLSETGRHYIHGSLSSFESLLPQSPEATSQTSSSDSDGDVVSQKDVVDALLGFEVEGCDDVEELMALKEKLEEMRERAAMALDWIFAHSLLSNFDDSILLHS